MRRPRKSINQINVVPYIDVMLVLLVIFMITAPLITPGEITLPSVGSVLTTPVAPMQIQIKRDATLMLKEGTASPVRVSRDELIARIKERQKQSPEQAVVIAADSDVRYEAVVAVLDMLQRNKVSKVGLLARRQPG
ncbi:MAG TPA: ExbD/TolR family protein [Casimicrobiaceae bacterium]|jgi:biopolymer transport protein TolR|nr:ExbD/TolR family protein [Casimicrobiaceae bacterium]